MLIDLEQTAAIVVTTCDECGAYILEGDEYYDIEKQTLCIECIENYKLIAEVE